MKKKTQTSFLTSLALLAAFGLWTLAVSRVDVQPIGPEGSRVGLAALNGAFHRLTGVHMGLYTLTDWLGLVPLAVALGFALQGLTQLIRRRNLRRVDASLYVLGGFYLLVMAAYALFEVVVINYRPVLIEGILEASYPSSTTMLVLCVIPTAMMRLHSRAVQVLLGVFAASMVAGRLMSGVHWFTDIVGGVLLSAGLVALYAAAVSLLPSET